MAIIQGQSTTANFNNLLAVIKVRGFIISTSTSTGTIVERPTTGQLFPRGKD